MAKKKDSLTGKIVVVGVVLIGVQIGYIFLFSQNQQSHSYKEAMNRTLTDANIPPERRDQMRIQLALNNYRIKKGQYPDTLEDLVPEYFDKVPLDPSTGLVYQYSVEEGNRALVGASQQEAAATAVNPTDGAKTADPKGEPDRMSSDEQDMIMAFLEKGDADDDFVYDSTGKRDPFRSFDFAPKEITPVGDTPLEQYPYEQLQFTAVIEDVDGTLTAMIELPNGKGYTAKIGTKIGLLGGTVMTVEAARITILESSLNFAGEKETRTVEMFKR